MLTTTNTRNFTPSAPIIELFDLGSVSYAKALALQHYLQNERVAGRGQDTLLLLEHPRVITYGKRAGTKHLIADVHWLEAQGFQLVETERGGDITYHGPGQLLIYFIMALRGAERSVPRLFWQIEQAVIDLLHGYGITAFGGTQAPEEQLSQDLHEAGVWVDNDKICALGMKLSHWVTSHGLALNINTKLQDFQTIIPCGLAHRGVVSMQQILSQSQDLQAIKFELANVLAERFKRTLHIMPLSSLDRAGFTSL